MKKEINAAFIRSRAKGKHSVCPVQQRIKRNYDDAASFARRRRIQTRRQEKREEKKRRSLVLLLCALTIT